MAEPSVWEDIRRAEMMRALEDVLRRRALIAPVGFVVVLSLFWFEPALWRRLLLAGIIPVMVALTAIEAVRARRGRLSASTAGLNAAIMFGGTGVGLVATGGIESPALPALLLNLVLACVLASERAARRLFAVTLLAIAGFVTVQLAFDRPGLPELFGGAAHQPSQGMVLARGLVMTMMSIGVFVITTRVRFAFGRMTERATAASRALVDGLADENRTLALLTAEIAHELKNPLASVKGLAGLVAKDVDGRAAERMTVLRREVDRMQTVLEQFLTLSRPVVPLEIARFDPRALCEEIAALHEGVAAERGVRLEVRAARELAGSGDARKLGQVLTNLVQNALAVSARGATIVIEAARAGEGLELRVLDEGPGLPPEIAARAFEPGVTSKPDGSGLGLAIARSLARQHGGDLELAARDGGGLAATVRLP